MSYSDVCKQLTNEAAALKVKIEKAKEDAEKRKSFTQSYNAMTNLSNQYKAAGKDLKHIIEDIQEFLSEKRKQGNLSVNAALLSARNVIPDSMAGVKLCTEGTEAWLESEDGMLVERMEGGGYRATVSLFMRKLALSSSQNTIQILILDELLSKLSAESSAIVSQYLNLLAQNSQLIVIEQKPEVYSRINGKKYQFFLAEGKTVVKEELLTNGEVNNSDGYAVSD